MVIIVEEEKSFYFSSRDSIVSILGDIGHINNNDKSYDIKDGDYKIKDVNLEDLIELTKKHSFIVEIDDGLIYLK